MIERLEELLDNSVVCFIVKGISVAVGVMFMILAAATAICAFFSVQWWAWVLLFIVCGVIAGAALGLYFYLADEY